MAYTDDWESLMNGVFGAGGKLKFGGVQPQPEKPQPEKPAGSGLPDLNAALLEQQKQLDELLKQQNARLKAQDAGVQTALEDSRQMLRDMEADGLLAKGTADTKPEQLGSFEGLAAEVKKTVLGQDAFVDSVVRAMRRPFVLGTEGAAARNVILLWGAPGTGRHFALAETARIMAARGLLQSDRMAVMDLALYPDPGAEKLFLQDLYAALHAPGEIVVFEHYESCHPGFLRILSDLAVKGSAPLSSRYLVNKEGILVEAGTALAPGAVSRIDPCGKYLIFFSRKGREALADKFGASFVAAVGDVCQTAPFTPEALAALAAQQLNALAQRVHSRLGLTLTAGADVRDYVAAQCSKEKGAEGLADCCERIFRALSEYCLQTDTKLSGTVALTAAPEGLQFALNGAAPADLFSLLPAAYTGAVEQIRAELDALVGLAPVKEYVFGLADNLQVQQRRAAAGFKTASLSMHMIFTGNPGTGKTTIARLVAKYLKAIGALGGGQLVEVTRADLVGRYTGHTAPLTNSVIESALGGVLFIDEAYSLYRGQQDSFGLEAIDTLVKGMEDHRDELVVILAGYTKEMEVFLTANSGLASRFPNKIEFPDYTADELLDITAVLAKGKGYRLAEGCTFPLLGYYKRRQALDSRTAGNGRLARNTLEKAIFNQSRRLIAEPAIDQVLGPYALAAVQCTHALGAIELVGTHGQHIHAQLLHIHGDGTHSLHRIGVHPDTVLVSDLGDLLDGLDGADLVVGHHDADQCGVGTDGSLHVLGADVALGGGTDIGHLKAHALQCSHAVHDGMMLKSAGDEVLFVLACLGEGGALYRPVVGLGAAAGKEELSRTCIDGLCHLRTAGVHEFLCLIADAVMAAGVAAGTAQGFDHHFQCLGSTGSGGSIIQINHFFHVFHRNDPFLLNASAGALNALCRCGILSTDKLYHIIP